MYVKVCKTIPLNRHMIIGETTSPYKIPHDCCFCIAYNLWARIVLLCTNAYLKDGVCKFVVSFASNPAHVIAIEIIRYCSKISKIRCETLNMLNILCIVYYDIFSNFLCFASFFLTLVHNRVNFN